MNQEFIILKDRVVFLELELEKLRNEIAILRGELYNKVYPQPPSEQPRYWEPPYIVTCEDKSTEPLPYALRKPL